MSTFIKPHWKRQADLVAAVAERNREESQNSSSAVHPTSHRTTPRTSSETDFSDQRAGARRRPMDIAAQEILLTTKQTARYIHYIYSHRSLERFRTDGGNKGPDFVKAPGEKGRVIYRKSDIDRWLTEMRTFRSTSEYPRLHRRRDEND